MADLRLVPVGLGDGEVEEDHALGVAAGRGSWFRGAAAALASGFELGEGDVDVVEVALFDGAGGGFGGVVGGGEGTGDVVDGERDLEAVVDADGGEDVEVVLGLVLDGRRLWRADLKTVWSGTTAVWVTVMSAMRCGRR